MVQPDSPAPPKTQRVLTGLLGAPIAQSAAPAMHERAAGALGLRCHYQLIEIPNAGKEDLRAILEGVRRLGFAGINVTFPYKETIIDLLDDMSKQAMQIGSANTVVVRDGRLIGHNTDTTGFARAIAPLIKASLRGPIVLIGAGGAGKAIGYALAGLGVAELRIVDSEPAKAAELAGKHKDRIKVHAVGRIEEALTGAAGLINASPVGMLPDRGMPVPASLLHDELWVADAVYSPLWTPLLVSARERGATVMSGREFAIYQAVDAFELFTGLAPSSHEMGIAFDDVMAKRLDGSEAS